MKVKHNLSTWIEIDSQAIRANWRAFENILGKQTEIMPVVKSNAYGHGMIAVAKICSEWRPKNHLCVASSEEGLQLKLSGIKSPILVLSWICKKDLELAIKNNLEMPVCNLNQSKVLNFFGRKLGKKVKVHLKIDSGTSRLGVMPGDFPALYRSVKKLPALKIVGVYSHFSSSENKNLSFSYQQLATFKKTISNLPNKIISHIGCSASSLVMPESRLDAVRLGISLYGLWPSAETKLKCFKKYPKFRLQPALSFKTRVISVKTVPANSFIGYAQTAKVARKTRIAVLPVGYYDGLDRQLSNNGAVLIGGKRFPIIGNICMNMTLIKVSFGQPIKTGDLVTIIGKSGKEQISADDIAHRLKTINYEVVTRLNSTIPRLII